MSTLNDRRVAEYQKSLNCLAHNYFVASNEDFLKFLSSFSSASETFLALWPAALFPFSV